MTDTELTEIAIRACAAELASRGMTEEDRWRLTVPLSTGITGSVALSARNLQSKDTGPCILIDPVISVRHEETSRIVTLLRDLPRGDNSYKWSTGVITKFLNDLMPEFIPLRHEWTMTSSTAGDSSRRIADDVVLYAFPFMERLRSVDGFLEEMKKPPHRFVRNYDLAVLLALQGRQEEAKRILKSISLPVSHNPTTWGDGDKKFAAFLDSFEQYFGLDLRIEEWPIDDSATESSKEPLQINIQDNGVVQAALKATGKNKQAQKAKNLTVSQLQIISRRVSEILADRAYEGETQAIADAALEIIQPERPGE